MGLISGFTIIRAISLFHITAAYFFLTAPKKLVDQNVVFMLGESTRLPHITTMDKPSDASAFLALIVAFLGVSDLTAANMTEEIALQYWLAAVPVRLLFLFVVTGYVYMFKPDGIFGSGSITRASIGEPLQNSLVFAWGFFELVAWFWVFTTLRDERREMAKRRQEKMLADAERNTL
ncbi:hypothetical protein LTR17_020804 [Elasticomyces elasticus]|nr:hypothetical protein LTR10_009750 [Elasticomyces elasticus]KAK4970040.1 hypothetical protein LTR42_008207 [Elasticomyces elasticus]KAK5707306.1 hypothetical protein LTR17_020804 [Elasticomyces elasticus]